MKKTYDLFRKYILIILILAFIGVIFGTLSLIHYYNDNTMSISFIQPIPIFAITFFALTVCAYVILAVKTPSLHVKRLKRDSGFSKFASALAAALVAALFLFDFVRFISPGTSLMTTKIVRLPVSVPFIIYFVIELIPSKIKRKKISIPSWLPPLCSFCAVAWCIVGLLSIYFWSGVGSLPTTNFFKITHMLYYLVAAIFFLADFSFSHLGKGHRLYVLSAFTLFTITAIFTGSTTIAKFAGLLTHMNISQFELVTAIAIGIFALSKMLAVPFTIKYVMKREGSSGHSHHHHHHHHHSKQKADSGVAKSDIPSDIDI